MSHTVEICLKYSGSLHELKGEVERVLGIQLPHYETGSASSLAFYGKLLTMDVELSTNIFDTDRHLDYSDFQYVLSTRIAGQVCADELLKVQVQLADVIGALLSRYLQVEVMVTVETEQLLARYKPSGASGGEQH